MEIEVGEQFEGVDPFEGSRLGPPRRIRRLEGHDYAGLAAYMVTVVTFDRRPLLARLTARGSVLTALGQRVEEEWFWSVRLRPSLWLPREGWCVMPDHIHGLVQVDPQRGDAGRSMSLSAFVGAFKAVTSRALNEGREGRPLWQPGFHERVIRDARHWHAAGRYIQRNPEQGWKRKQRRGGW